MPAFYFLRWEHFAALDYRAFFRVLRWITEVSESGTLRVEPYVTVHPGIPQGLEFMHENNVAYMVRISV